MKQTKQYMQTLTSKQGPSIAILGSVGSFHQIAAQTFYKKTNRIINCKTPEEVLWHVRENDACHGGVLAVENSLAGLVTNHYQSVQNSGLKISGELLLKIQHQLVALPGTYVHDIWELRSHPMAIRQCSNYLARMHPSTRLLQHTDTASAAKDIAQHQLEGVAAICSNMAAEQYGLEILASNIENNHRNYTRFLMLSKASQQQAQHNKATITFRLQHQIGSLSRLLRLLEKAKVNLCKLHSFPVEGQADEYAFIAELEFEQVSLFQDIQQALHTHTKDLQIMGTYQKDRQPILATVNN